MLILHHCCIIWYQDNTCLRPYNILSLLPALPACITVIMNPRAQSYGYGYLDLINAFGTEELEELLFGYPSSPSDSTAFWDWVNLPSSTAPSPPALAPILNSSSSFSYSGKSQKPQWLSTLLLKARMTLVFLFQTPSIIFRKREPPPLLNPKGTISKEGSTPTIYAPVIPMDELLQRAD
ncbi:hypothetical protein O181_101276 [Austropuccinia psidii MF-1]|uniref:Uncharacterized protein n=1 Tax=Austropuccinia psidii MF-1 TaxID=1389203 RepID=A0A9Q3PII0_9BASI|nr:hypothetical protein [Austropuccinia psidii MF-1]